MTTTLEHLLWYNSLSQKDRDLYDALQRTKNKKQEIRTEETPISDAFKKELVSALKTLRGNNRNATAENKLRLARASNYSTARLEGKLRAYASVSNPLTTGLELVITLLDVSNGNKQGIKRSEAQNIIDTALHAPLKVHYDGSIKGHIGASVAGVITQVADSTDRIIGKALLWNEENPDLIEYLKEQSELYTSWEIYYASAEQDRNGISWLQNCIFAGIALVSNPAYGPENSRARIV